MFAIPFLKPPQSRASTARYAGVLYVLMAICAAFSLMQIPSHVLVSGDAAATLRNLLTHESTVRWVMVSHFACHSLFLLLAMTLYRLLKDVHRHSAQLMVLFVLAQVPLVFVGEALSYAALMIAKGELLEPLQGVQEKALQADIAFLLLKLRSYILLTAQVFWGLWLIPLGRLVFRSVFIPRFLGILLIAGGVAYLVQTSVYILLPMTYSSFVSVLYPIHTIAEVAMMLWLVIIGARDKQSTFDKQAFPHS